MITNAQKIKEAKETFEMILDDLLVLEEFEESFKTDVFGWFNTNYNIIPEHIHWATGATKMVIWDDDKEYVFKMNLNGYDTDYCAAEVENYHKAVESNLEEYFAWCDSIGTIFGKNVYVMDFYDCDFEENSDKSCEYQFKIFCEDNGYDENDVDAEIEFDNSYGDFDDEECMLELITAEYCRAGDAPELLDFLYKNHINDLHSGNVSINNGRAVFVDYSGFA